MARRTNSSSKSSTPIKKRKTTKLSKVTKAIKKHEKIYTFLLVMFFVILFIIIGYFTLRIQ